MSLNKILGMFGLIGAFYVEAQTISATTALTTQTAITETIMAPTITTDVITPITTLLDKADNGFMMMATVLVLFMSVPGIALFYGGLLRSKNVLSILTQTLVCFSLVLILWVIYGYSLTFSGDGLLFGDFGNILLIKTSVDDLNGTISQLIWVAFQGSFSERIRFAALLIFVMIWFSFSYIPIAHMVWGGGILSDIGALDFAGGTVVYINAAVAGLVGAYLIKKRLGFKREPLKPFNLPMVYLGAAILYIGWFGFNAGSAVSADHIAALTFINTVLATAAAILCWSSCEWLLRGSPSCLGACSGIIAGLVGITPAAGFVGISGALVIGLVGIYLLLQEQEKALYYFNRLTDEEQNHFVNFLIYHFWKI